MSVDDQREEVQRVLDSAHFRRAPKLQCFLELICDYHFQNRSAEINEFVIATEAFGKSTEFDPGHDSLVRVQAREARRRLREYYQNEGKDSLLVIDIPTGSYVPVFTQVQVQAPAVLPPVMAPVKRRIPPPKMAWMMLAATALACTVILLAADRERRQLVLAASSLSVEAAGNSSPLVSGLWNRFMNSDVATVLVLSNPDVGECNEETPPAKSIPPNAKASKAGPVAASPCPDEYTGMGEAVALHLISNLFQSRKKTLIVKQSRMVTEDDVRRYNLIMLGGKHVNIWTKRLGADLRLAAEATDVAPAQSNSSPAQRFETAFDTTTGKLIRDRGLIALRRHPTTGHWLLFLWGKHTQGTHAAAEATLDERFLAQLHWPAPGTPFPDSFRVLVGVNVNDGLPEGAVPVSLRVP
jgi:hypothetical protein